MDRFNKFTVLVNSIVRSVHKIKCAEMNKLGLKSTHVSCLYYLYRADGALTAKELCDACGEDKAAVSRAVDFLGREGFVTTGGEASKKYKSPIALTQKGEAAARLTAERVDCNLASASEGLSEDDRAAMYRGLELVADNLQKICDGRGGGDD